MIPHKCFSLAACSTIRWTAAAPGKCNVINFSLVVVVQCSIEALEGRSGLKDQTAFTGFSVSLHINQMSRHLYRCSYQGNAPAVAQTRDAGILHPMGMLELPETGTGVEVHLWSWRAAYHQSMRPEQATRQ